jgi:hypothetical protein
VPHKGGGELAVWDTAVGDEPLRKGEFDGHAGQLIRLPARLGAVIDGRDERGPGRVGEKPCSCA